MSQRAKELREALRFQDQIESRLMELRWTEPDIDALREAFSAAREIALPLLEAESELVERIAGRVYDIDPSIQKPPYWGDCTDEQRIWYRSQAREILAAITEASQ